VSVFKPPSVDPEEPLMAAGPGLLPTACHAPLVRALFCVGASHYRHPGVLPSDSSEGQAAPAPRALLVSLGTRNSPGHCRRTLPVSLACRFMATFASMKPVITFESPLLYRLLEQRRIASAPRTNSPHRHTRSPETSGPAPNQLCIWDIPIVYGPPSGPDFIST